MARSPINCTELILADSFRSLVSVGGVKRKSGGGTGSAASKSKAAKADDIAAKYPYIRKITTWFFG